MSDPQRVDPPAFQRLSGQDAVFLYGETHSMPMHTMGTVILDPSEVPGGYGFDDVVQTVASRIHLLPPFRQRVLEVPLGIGHPVRVDDPDFDIRNHVHRLGVPAPGGLRELAEIVGDLASRPLDRSQPLWEMWVVEGLADGRIALVTKLHHCIMDGASGSSQMANLMQLEPDAPVEAAPPWRPAPLPSSLALAVRSIGSRFVGPLALGRLAFDTLKSVRSRAHASRELARPETQRSELLAPDTPLNRALGARRSVAYGSVPLDDVKRAKNAFGVTVNDVVLAASSLVLRRYLERRDALPDAPLVCVVPVSLKTAGEKKDFSNKVSVLTVRLPTHLAGPEEVVRAVHRETADAKRLHEAGDADLVPAWLQLAPPLLTHFGVRLFSDRHLADRTGSMWNVVVSNVMGPPVPLYFGAARVEAVYPMGPVGEGIGLNITILSNMGRLDLGVLACSRTVPDPWEITEGFVQAVADLVRAAEKLESVGPDA